MEPRLWTQALFIGLLVGLICVAPLRAAPGVTVAADVTVAWTDNLFQSYAEQGDWLQQISLDVDLGGPYLGGYYSARANRYTEYEDLFSQTHTLGLALAPRSLGRGSVVGDLQLSLRQGRTDIEYRDYLEARASVAGKRYLQPSLLLRAGGDLSLRDYRVARDFSFVEPTAYVRLSRFMRTRTTLEGGLNTGLRVYLRSASDESTYARNDDDAALMQATMWARAAQSIGATAGLQLQVARTFLPVGASSLLQPDLYDPVSELFDDDYAFRGDEVRLTLKQKGAAGMTWLFSVHQARRYYDDRPALSLDGEPLESGSRHDTRRGARLRLDRSLGKTPGLPGALALRLEWSLMSVDSNDPYYDASLGIYAATLRFGL